MRPLKDINLMKRRRRRKKTAESIKKRYAAIFKVYADERL